jgi:hypothetical protein
MITKHAFLGFDIANVVTNLEESNKIEDIEMFKKCLTNRLEDFYWFKEIVSNGKKISEGVISITTHVEYETRKKIVEEDIIPEIENITRYCLGDTG